MRSFPDVIFDIDGLILTCFALTVIHTHIHTHKVMLRKIKSQFYSSSFCVCVTCACAEFVVLEYLMEDLCNRAVNPSLSRDGLSFTETIYNLTINSIWLGAVFSDKPFCLCFAPGCQRSVNCSHRPSHV